jgi:hypothetical protein
LETYEEVTVVYVREAAFSLQFAKEYFLILLICHMDVTLSNFVQNDLKTTEGSSNYFDDGEGFILAMFIIFSSVKMETVLNFVTFFDGL